jgi:ubiquinone/menaquinone biosynthesis C-methylase UbiE
MDDKAGSIFSNSGKKIYQFFYSVVTAVVDYIFFLPFGGYSAYYTACCEFGSIKPGNRVLDLCCGGGELTCTIAEQRVPKEIIGVDIAASSIKKAHVKTAYVPADFVIASVGYLPFPENTFNKCFISLGLHHLSVEIRQRAFSEAYRVLVPDGQLYIFDFNVPERQMMKLIILTLSRFDDSREAYKMLKAGSLLDEIRNAGFYISRRILVSRGMFQFLELIKSR